VIEIFALGADDWRRWRVLRLEALATDPIAFGSTLADWQGENDREERWRRRFEVESAVNFVAELDGRPAGMAADFPTETPGCRELISMWVAPFARGRGVGDALIREVVASAERHGATELELSVVVDNAPALALYRRHGFVETGAIELRDDGRSEARMRRHSEIHRQKTALRVEKPT
jgi:ribosomal protein S18 acetylase RimI-like enzyme